MQGKYLGIQSLPSGIFFLHGTAKGQGQGRVQKLLY